MSENPYGKYLGDRDALSILETTVDRIAALTRDQPPGRLEEPLAPGKWSVHQVIAHLADNELATCARSRWILNEENPTLIGYDQDLWMKGWMREEEPFDDTFARFRVLRNSQLRLLRSCSEADLARTGTHSERGEISIAWLRDLVAGHDINHLLQLEQALAKSE
jgi:hypothetical protein